MVVAEKGPDTGALDMASLQDRGSREIRILAEKMPMSSLSDDDEQGDS